MRAFRRLFFSVFLRISKFFSRKGLKNFLGENIAEIPAESNVLSIGAGGPVGETVRKAALENRFEVKELDVDEDLKPDIVADLCKWKDLESYDFIICSEVLEHTYHPHQAMQNMYDSLKPGGKLIFSTPFVFPIHTPPHDYFRFTKYGLAYLFKDFERVSINKKNNWGEAITVLLTRTILGNENRLALFSPLFIILALLLYPCLYISAVLLPSDFITSGYTVTAFKPISRLADFFPDE